MDRFTALIDFNQEKALVGAFSVITNPRMDLLQALAARSPDLLPGAAVGGQEAARVVEAGLAQPQLQQRHVAPPAGQLAPALCLACNMPRVTGATCHWSHV